MKNKFYAVVTKCGHVGRNNYREVTFPINASSRKEAAKIARWIPRVKHHIRDAIIDVNEVCFETYKELLEKNSNDPYFHCKNIQEQNKYCTNLYLEIKSMNSENYYDNSDKRIERVIYKNKRNKVIENDIKDCYRGLTYESYVL